MTVAAILARKGRLVLTVTRETPIPDVVRLLAERRIGAAVVADDLGHVLGIVSERDIVRRLADQGPAGLQGPVAAIMTTRVVTCGEPDTLHQVMARMTEGRFRHLPVVENGRLSGIISIGDVVKARIEQVEREADEMRSYIAMG